MRPFPILGLGNGVPEHSAALEAVCCADRGADGPSVSRPSRSWSGLLRAPLRSAQPESQLSLPGNNYVA